MPGFKEGKYGKYNSYIQFSDANARLASMLEEMGNKALYDKLLGFTEKLGGKTNNVRNVEKLPEDRMISTGSGEQIKNYFNVQAVENEAEAFLDELHAYLGDFLKNHDKKYDPYIGYFKQAYLMSDTKNGSYAEAVYDSPYLFGIQNMTACDPKIEQYGGRENFEAQLCGDQTDPITKAKVPLGYINEWFANSADLYAMAQKKQTINAQAHTAEEEAAYLDELDRVYTKTLTNFDRFHAFAKKEIDPKTGTSKYDQYFSNKLDMFTGVAYCATESSRRSARPCFSWIRGEHQAIKNGWGMNELGVLGSVYAMADAIEDDYRYFENDYNPNALRTKIDAAEQKIANANEKITTLRARLKNEKDAQRKADIRERIAQWEGSIEENKQSIADDRKSIEQYDERKAFFKKEIERVNALKKEVSSIRVTNESDKYMLAGKLNSYLKSIDDVSDRLSISTRNAVNTKKTAENQLNSILPKLEEAHKSRNASLFASRKIAELPDDLLDDKTIKDENAAYVIRHGGFSMVMGKFLNEDQPALKEELNKDKIGGYGIDEIELMVNDRFDEETPKKFSSYVYGSRSGNGFNVELISREGERERWESKLDAIHKKWTEQYMKCDKTDAVFKPYTDSLGTMFDVKKGNMLQAYSDNMIVRGLCASFADGPRIFKENHRRANDFLSHAVIKETLDKNGVTVPFMSFYSGVGETIEAEFYKQNAMKSGWNKAKEKIYFSKLTKAYEKVINAHSELAKLPDDIQNDRSVTDNTLASTTGIGGFEGRSSFQYMDAMRWNIQAMQNGWSKDNMVVMSSLGFLEGGMNLYLYQLNHRIKLDQNEVSRKQTEVQNAKARGEDTSQLEAEINQLNNDIARTKDSAAKLEEFKKNEFAEFKKELFDKKINSPADVIEVLNKIEEFRKANENHPAVNTEGNKVTRDHLLNSPLESFKVSMDIVSNDAIRELEKTVEAEKVPGTNTFKELTENEQKEISRLEEISAASKSCARTADFLLAGIGSKQNLDYETALKMTSTYFENRYLSEICGEEHPELFDKNNFNYRKAVKLLEKEADKFAKTFLDKFYPPVVDAQNNVMPRTIKGDELVNILAFGGLDTQYREVTKKIEAGLRRANMEVFTDGSMTNTQRDESGKIISSERIRINDNLKRTCNRLSDANNNINFHFTSDLYYEITDRMSKLYKEKLALDKKIKKAFDAAKNKPGEEYSEKPLKIDQKAYDSFKLKVNTMHYYLDKYIDGKEAKLAKGKKLNRYERQHFEAAKDARNAILAIKYQLHYFGNNGPSNLDIRQEELEYNVDKDSIMGNVNSKKIYEHNKMVELKNDINAMNAREAENRENLAKQADAHRDDIVKSAEREIYLTAISSVLGKESGANVIKNAENNSLLRKVVEDLETGKGTSADFERFRRKCFDDESFRKEFADKVMASVKAGKSAHQDILKCRDEALHSAIQKNVNNTAELTKLEEIKKVMGANVEPVMIHHNPAVVNHVNNRNNLQAGNHPAKESKNVLG